MANRIEIVVDAKDKSLDTFKKVAKKLVDQAGDTGTDAGESLVDAVAAELKSGAREWERAAERGGEDAGQALRDGIEGEVKETDIAAELKRPFTEAGDDAERAGDKAGKALADGVEDAARRADPAQRMQSGFDDVKTEAKQAGDRAGRELADGVEDGARKGAGGIKGAFSGLGSDLKSALAEAGETGGNEMMDSLKDSVTGGKGPLLGALAALGGVAAKAFMDNVAAESRRVDLQNKLGLSPEEAAAFGKEAGRIYGAGWGESLEAVNATAQAVAQNLNMSVSDVDFAPIVRQAQQFSDIFGVDSVEAVRAVAQMMRTGLVDSATEGFDALTRLYQEGGAMSDDFLETLNEYPTQFRNLGLSAEDAMNLMIQGLRGGARDSDVVADALKELRIRVLDLSAADGLRKIGLDAGDMADAFAEGGPAAREALDTILTKLQGIKDPAERARTAVELFGTQGEDMADALNELSLEPVRNELGKTSGALSEAAANARNTMENDWKKFGRGLQMIFTDTGTSVDIMSDVVARNMAETVGVSTEFAGGVKNNMGITKGAFDTAARGARGLTGDVKGIPKHKRVTLNANDNATWKAKRAKSWIDSLRDKVVTITFFEQRISSARKGIPPPRFASGGVVGASHAQEGGPRGNQVLVGEQGPEIVDLPSGSMVNPAGESRQMMTRGGEQRVVLDVRFSGTTGSRFVDALMEDLQERIRKQYGGNVASALGQS